MTPTLKDENLRRLLLAESIESHRRRPAIGDLALLSIVGLFVTTFIGGLIWKLLLLF